MPDVISFKDEENFLTRLYGKEEYVRRKQKEHIKELLHELAHLERRLNNKWFWWWCKDDIQNKIFEIEEEVLDGI